MNQSQKLKIMFGLLIASATTMGIAHAKGHPMGKCAKDPAQAQACMQEHMVKRQEHLFKKLNVNDAQKKQIQAIMLANKPNHEASMKQMQQMREQMKSLREANVAKDDPKAVALHDQMKAFHDSKRAHQEQVSKQIRAILTPEQAKTFDEMNAKREQHRKHEGPKHRSMGEGMGPAM